MELMGGGISKVGFCPPSAISCRLADRGRNQPLLSSAAGSRSLSYPLLEVVGDGSLQPGGF